MTSPAPAPEPAWFCVKADGTKHGAFVRLFPDGAIEITGTYKDGVLDGVWERQYPNGQLAETGAYALGKKHGKWRQLGPTGATLGEYELTAGTGTERRWLADGTLYSEIAFKDGAEHGLAKIFMPDGTVIGAMRYASGKLDGPYAVGSARTMRFEEKYAGGVRVGDRKIWNGNAPIADEHFDRRGRLDGDYKLWRRRGVPRAEGRFASGKRTGLWTWYDRDGNKEREGRYVAGARDGTWTEWWENKVAFIGTYVAGKPEGDLVYFDRNGNELGKSTLKDGTGTLQTFWGNGRPSSRQRLFKGTADGLYQELTLRGRVVVEGKYRGGVKHGVWRAWTPDGVLALVETYKRGKLDGSVKKYVDGKPSLEASYLDGQADGVYTELRNGTPAVTGSYAADRKHGTWTHHAADGAVILTATYKTGVLDGPWRQLVDGVVLEGTMTAGRRSGTWTSTDRAGNVRKLAYTSP